MREFNPLEVTPDEAAVAWLRAGCGCVILAALGLAAIGVILGWLLWS